MPREPELSRDGKERISSSTKAASIRRTQAQRLGIVQRALVPRTLVRQTNSPPILINAAGPVYLKPARMRFYPIQFALLRLQELHRKAVGKSDKFSTKVASRLSRNSAKLAYGNSFYIALGQLITVGPRTQLEIFKEICGFVSKRTSLDGLEGLFLTGLQAARTHRAIAGATNVGATGVELWGQLGPPQLLGGGAGVMPIYGRGWHQRRSGCR